MSRGDLDGTFCCVLLPSDSEDRDSAQLFAATALRVQYTPGEPHEIWAIRVATPGLAQGVKCGARPSAATTTSIRDGGEGEGGFAAIARLKAMLCTEWCDTEWQQPIYVPYRRLCRTEEGVGGEGSLPRVGIRRAS